MVMRVVAVLLMVFMFGCSQPQGNGGVLKKDWQDIEADAQGGLVKLYMYGGLPQVNEWVDTYVAEEVKKRFGISLVRVPLDANVVVAKLLAEKGTGKNVGGVDLVWLNGENFKTAKEGGVLFGPFAEKLPNYLKYIDKRLAAYDFGYPVEGYEVPLGRTQFVFEYDSAEVPNPPRSFLDLLRWTTEHPGRFTYSAPPDFTGSAFIRQAFYSLTGGSTLFESGWNEKAFNNSAPKLWEYLNEMKPYLWRAGVEYPKDAAALDSLFATGETLLSMSYGPHHASVKVRNKVFRPSVRTYIMNDGSFFNMHFMGIPETAPNKAGAMVVANFLLSPEAQLSKFRPESWGDFPSIDLSTLDKEMWQKFESVEHGEAALTPKELHKAGIPEISAEYVEALEKGWIENVK
ncbi:ABC transporter substrate-binding protein [Pseudodesulfovibrio sp. zrk46]|uniref:ABC transporter substrate-binding protein n=1 Tax=Pseudodesulfovibrio sp. zrk46 TaxID=2725288 RepID=UPI001FFD3601|nr:ABC transporter substrate-binding protein [Pseudodesulfovibrio sp. zrk46]